MGNCISIPIERGERSENVENVPDVLPLEDELENLSQPNSIEICPSSTLTSSKTSPDHPFMGSCDQRSNESVPDLKRLENKSKCNPEPPSITVQSEPSRLSKSSKQASDQNCKKSCGLQYGISDVFAQTVLEQQKVKFSKSHIKPKTFDNPNDQKYYGHMLEDVMIKNFNTDDEQKIFRKSLEGMKANYPEILEGREKKYVFLSRFLQLQFPDWGE